MMQGLAAAIAARGRWVLIAGLILGLAVPAAADAMRPLVGPIVIALLFLALLRIGPDGLSVGVRNLRHAALLALTLQCAVPIAVMIVFQGAGVLDRHFALAALLILAAAPITGAAHIAVMAGGDPAPALRQTVIGTALLPLTVLPVFALAPAFGDAREVFGAVLRLLVVISVAGALAYVLRSRGLVSGSPSSLKSMDAIAAVLLGAVVIGMMGAAGDALRSDPVRFALAMGLVFMIAFGLQATVVFIRPDAAETPAVAVTAGCRNVALFLGVLPASVSDDLLLYIGCYQIPMYLTPLVLPRLLALRRIGS